MEDIKKTHPDKIFWNWDIHYACNYRCTYCFFADQWDIVKKKNRYPGIDKLIDIWNQIYDRYGSCHLHFSGGEPFNYPDFFKLLEALANKHTFEFSTNLSFDILSFTKILSPSKAKIDASFHPQFVNIELFLEKVIFLKNKGYEICVSFVAFPPHLEMIDDFRDAFENNGIAFVVQVFRGKLDQKQYPDSYTEREKEFLSKYVDLSPVSKKHMDHHLSSHKEEKLCKMGQMYVKVHPDGTMYRCCTPGAQKLGNLFDGDFALLTEPTLCHLEQCHCYKAMLEGKEDSWASFWVYPDEDKERK